MVASKLRRTGWTMHDYTLAREAMVDRQVRPSDVTRHNIIDAMLDVPRETFVPASQRSVAYVDRDVPLGKGRALLAPRTFSKMLDTVEIGLGETVLDVGCGLGYSSAVIARLCRGVIAVEQDEAMASAAEANLASLAIDNVVVLTGDTHFSAAGNLHRDFADETSDIVAHELVGTSIATANPPIIENLIGEFANALFYSKYANGTLRGYAVHTVTPDDWQTDYRVISDTTVPGGVTSTDASMKITSGVPGLDRLG